MKARIKQNAGKLFLKKERKLYPNTPLPQAFQEYYQAISNLEGKVLEVDYLYPDKKPKRAVLLYPNPKHEIVNGHRIKIVGIDTSLDLVELIRDGNALL